MAHNAHFPHSAQAHLSNGITYTVLAAAAALVGILIFVDAKAQSDARPDTVQSEIEDWHGNVRRSHQSY